MFSWSLARGTLLEELIQLPAHSQSFASFTGQSSPSCRWLSSAKRPPVSTHSLVCFQRFTVCLQMTVSTVETLMQHGSLWVSSPSLKGFGVLRDEVNTGAQRLRETMSQTRRSPGIKAKGLCPENFSSLLFSQASRSDYSK